MSNIQTALSETKVEEQSVISEQGNIRWDWETRTLKGQHKWWSSRRIDNANSLASFSS